MAEVPDQTELPFMCLAYGMEEAAKHPVPDGKYIKVAWVHEHATDCRLVAAWFGFLLL